MKKTLLALGTIATIVTPVASIVACSSSNSNDETYRGKLAKGKELKIMTLGDSVAHGDYTFQMSGSGTGFTPFVDGPARVASYQDWLFDEFKRDGLMSEEDQPDYKLSASGLRSGELAQWLKTGTYLKGMIADNPIKGTPEEQKAIQEHIDYHRHPYTYQSGSESWWDDGLVDASGKQLPVKHLTIDKAQKDQKPMAEHVKNSDIVLITIGGNDILKDIMIAGVPFPNLGTIDWSAKINQLVGALVTDKTLNSQPGIKKVLAQLPTLVPKVMPIISGLKAKMAGLISGATKPGEILGTLMKTFGPFLSSLTAVPENERLVFDKWFLSAGHKMLITVDQDKLKESLDGFSKNIKLMSDEIHSMNPNASVIFTGYPSPMMHFPKIFRNLAMPTYGQIAKLTEEYANSAKGVYFAPSSLKNWETDDPKDIYDNILVDPHPTLEGQGVMARDIIKVIDKIYGFHSKITDEEINAQVADEVESHKLTAPKMSEADRNAALAAGTYQFPYQTNAKPALRGDLDYAYGVKSLPLEEITHAKVYFPSRIVGFLVDAITDAIKLNTDVKNSKDQSVPYSGPLTLSSFTKQWADNYLKLNTDKRFIQPLGKDFQEQVASEFENSLIKFINTFAQKVGDSLSATDSIQRIQNILDLFK